MQYKNIKTGYILETECEISGRDWIKLSSEPLSVEEPEPAKKKKKED